MNVATERAREACDSCRKSHKKCTYDDNSTRCVRCEKRNTACSLFLSVETTAVAQQAPTLLPVGSPDSWTAVGTPHASSSASSNPSYQFPPQEDYYWTTTALAGNVRGENPAAPTDMIFQGSANQHEIEQPVMNQDSMYGHISVFGALDGS